MILADIESRVEEHLRNRPHSGTSFWETLVRSSRRMDGDGCDGALLDQAVKCGLEVLEDVPDGDLVRIWQETENGMMAMEGETGPLRGQMLVDIEVELHGSLCERVCDEAMARTRQNNGFDRER